MKRHLTRVVRLFFTGIILVMLVVFATKVNWHSTWAAIQDSSISILLLAAAVNLFSLGLKGVRWWIFLRPIGASSLFLALRATFAGAGLNNVLVANSGEAARVIFVSRAAHITSAKVLATLALERLFELIGYVVMLALAVSFLPLPPVLERTRPFAWFALALIAGFLIYLVRRPESPDQIIASTEIGWRAKTRWRGFRGHPSRSSPSTKRIAFLNGATSSARSTGSSAHCAKIFRTSPSRHLRPARRPVRRGTAVPAGADGHARCRRCFTDRRVVGAGARGWA